MAKKRGKRRTITATELSKETADVLDAVIHRGESFAVERRGKTVCWIVPPQKKKRYVTGAELLALLDDFGPLPPDYIQAVRNARTGGMKLAPPCPPS